MPDTRTTREKFHSNISTLCQAGSLTFGGVMIGATHELAGEIPSLFMATAVLGAATYALTADRLKKFSDNIAHGVLKNYDQFSDWVSHIGSSKSDGNVPS